MPAWHGAAAGRSGASPPGRPGSRPGATDSESHQFRALLESAPDAMVIVDGGGTIRLVNAQTEALFGYQRDELLGRSVEILIPRRLRNAHAAHRLGYAARPQLRPMGGGLDLSGRRRDGSEFPAEIRLSPLEANGGLLVSAAVRDVSDRKAAERRISELALIAESSQDAIFTGDLDGTITFWNGAATRLYGYSAAEAVGRPVSMLVPPGREDEISKLLKRIGRGERIEHYEALRVTRSGETLNMDVSLDPVRTPSGAIVGVCAIARDITERKRVEHELTRLYEQQRHIALTLQRSLMGTPREVPDIQTAARYLPATRGAGVGGDWFDLISLGAGRTGVLIGDVMGRGLQAATVMGQVRSAANALARTGMPPQQLMHALDAVVLDLAGQLVTCCYLIINAYRGEITASSAGHLPTLLVRPDATVDQLPVPVSVPLGVGGIPHQEAALAVQPGATLVLYTDGLVETRGGDLDRQIRQLEAELHSIFSEQTSLGQAADQALAALPPDPRDPTDDVTFLLARIPAAPQASAHTELPPEPQHVIAGRRFISDTPIAWDLPQHADTACLLASELLTNAVRHARRAIGVQLYRTPGQITVEITDDNARLPSRTLPEPTDEYGRGLNLVESLAQTWGTLPTRDGKIVWFTLATDPTG